MGREFQDEDFRTWEVYATTGPFGFAAEARIVFHCLTDPSLRARVVAQEGDRADVEGQVVEASVEDLGRMLGEAEEVK